MREYLAAPNDAAFGAATPILPIVSACLCYLPRHNRNERLRTLIAAYKTLGGSFTGDLSVNPAHRRDNRLRLQGEGTTVYEDVATSSDDETDDGWDRPRRIRDAVEATLSDIILLGTEEQVRLAERAVRDLVAGRSVHTHELVLSLRDFIREALDLAPIPADLQIPAQGPTRPASSGGRGKGERGAEGSRGGGGGGGAVGGIGGSGMSGGFGIGGSADQHIRYEIGLIGLLEPDST